MHEVGVMQSALEIALEQAGRQGRAASTASPCASACSPAWSPRRSSSPSTWSRGDDRRGGRLVVERVPILCVCAGCEAEFRADDLIFDCPRCGRPGARVRHGRELELAYLEVS